MSGSVSANIRQQGALDELVGGLSDLIVCLEDTNANLKQHTGRLIGWEPEPPAPNGEKAPLEEAKVPQLRHLLYRAHQKLADIQHEVNRLNEL